MNTITRKFNYIKLTLLYNMNTEKWQGNISNQREFVDALAKRKGFHPIAEHHRWYDITKEDFTDEKVSN